MARIRNSSTANSAANSRKRSRESASPARSPKRRQELNLDMDAPSLPSSFSRENSPSKNVHWGRGSRIISGPTVTDPQRRSQSPTRPALRRPAHEDDDDHGDIDSEDDGHEASKQLQADLCEASPGKRPPKKAYHPKNLPSGVGNVYVSPSAKAAKSSANTTSGNDEDICKQIDSLKDTIWKFANRFPSRSKKAKSDVLAQLMQPENEQLVRYVGCISMGGGEGEKGWQKLLTDDASRKAVVWGVLGKALKEHVFDELYFGAWPALESKLRKMEREQARQDGFYRQRSRSAEILKSEAGFSRAQNNTALERATARITLGLETLLLPLWCLDAQNSDATWTAQKMPKDLFTLVLTAAQISRAMRRSRDVIYYWPPTLKDEEFEPARMECLNLNDMIRHSPYDKQEIDGRDRPILREGQDGQSQAIVRVVCFPGIQAYRQGGGDLGKQQLAAERAGVGRNADGAPPDVVAVRRKVTNRYGEEYTGNEGIRTRVISKGVVLLQWGQQRLLTKEAGTSVHVDAMKAGNMKKYEQDARGHVELFKLFEEKMAGAKVTAAKASALQQQQERRSPSLMAQLARPFGFFTGAAEEVDEDEGEGHEVPGGNLLVSHSRPHRAMDDGGDVVRVIRQPTGRKTNWR